MFSFLTLIVAASIASLGIILLSHRINRDPEIIRSPENQPLNIPVVHVVLNHPQAVLPSRATPQSAGLDLTAVEDVILGPGDRALVPTGIVVVIPEGYEGQVRSRSGLALKRGLVVLNAPGTIDSDYRGELGVILHNTSKVTAGVSAGDRVAQLVIAKVDAPILTKTTFEEVSETTRGQGGFGSTGGTK